MPPADATPPPPPPPPARAAGGAERVLLVDDNPANRFAVGYWLREAGYDVTEAASGAEALASMERHPDLVVLDIRLPDMSGFDVLQRIRARPGGPGVPVLHLSASFTSGEWRAQGLEAGADGYLTHPVEPREFVATVRALLRVRAAESERERVVVAERAARAEAEGARAEAERARAEAEQARRVAEAANAAKSGFLATMSHELRTPINAVLGYTELIELGLSGPVTDAQRAQLGRVRASAHHLLGLINEVLDLAKVEAGEMQVERAAVTAGATVDAALALVRPQAAAKALALSESCGGAADVPYLGDETRVRQVLVNLLANAVKFTPAGGRVQVTCALTDAPPPAAHLPAGAPFVALRVSDTGVGIAGEQLERIFLPFTQGDSGLTRSSGGTGLGLTISRRLARLMGGELTVESRSGAGSEFTLWLPTIERRATPRGTRAVALGGPASAGARAPSPAHPPTPRGDLARLGDALLVEVGPMLRAWLARLRADAAIPDATRAAPDVAVTDAELEDHAATFVTDVALALRVLDASGGEPAALMRDGTAILGVIAERHGAQRARLGWPEAAIARELALLGETMEATLERAAPPADADVLAHARQVVRQLLAQAARTSVGGFRLAAPGAPPESA